MRGLELSDSCYGMSIRLDLVDILLKTGRTVVKVSGENPQLLLYMPVKFRCLKSRIRCVKVFGAKR